jgi:hypothetical protein
MNTDAITALIITRNESPNLADTLQRLKWAKRIVVVDSHSSDETVTIARRFANVEVFERTFDTFADQCNFGISKIDSEWCLSIDADYKCTNAFFDELAMLDGKCDSYRAAFSYCIHGKPLRGSLYPPRVVLYRTAKARYEPDGHAHRVKVQGSVGTMKSKLLHDDRKPLSNWIAWQSKYATQELDKLLNTPASQLGWVDWVRLRTWVSPALVFVYLMFRKGLILDGAAGANYTFQRVFAEVLLCLMVSDQKLATASQGKQFSQ